MHTAVHGARLSSVPSGDRSANPAALHVFQGTVVSSEHTSQFFPPGNVPELRCSPQQLVRL